MARKTVSPQSLSPEQQRSLSIFLRSLQEYDTLKTIPLPKTVLPTDFRCFMDGKIPRNALICDDHWSWNQSNAKIRTITEDGMEIIIQKLNPRKKPDTPLQRPSYKIWILSFRQLESDNEHKLFVWCEKGINAPLDHLPKPARSAPPSYAPFTLQAPLSPIPSTNPNDLIAEMIDVDSDSLMADFEAILDDPDSLIQELEGQQQGELSMLVDPVAPPFHNSVSHFHAGESGPSVGSPKLRTREKRTRSITYPFCTIKLAPLFQDPAWEEGDQLMMDYVTAEERPLCAATLTSSLGNQVVSVNDIDFLQQFGAPKPTCRMIDVHCQN